MLTVTGARRACVCLSGDAKLIMSLSSVRETHRTHLFCVWPEVRVLLRYFLSLSPPGAFLETVCWRCGLTA